VIDIDIQDAGGVTAPEERLLRPWIESVIERHPQPGPVEICLRIVGKDESRQLNRDYRGKDRPTNVLSFAAGDDVQPPEGPVFLGDIVICGPVVEEEAADQRKALADHWAHLVVHGTLHLLGYDHESESEAAAMEALETSILGEHGIPDPYAA
jgi:probable rRNA maturation factor